MQVATAMVPTAATFQRDLLTWYDQHGRNLPWRQSKDPYAILVSELMLQQTQVKTVIPYYHRFLEQFPDPATLAVAAEAVVLRAWQGLGYYRRARHLQAAAQQITSEHNGQFPRDKAHIDNLKGVGAYTAAAVASIAFKLPHACVDGNVIRVITRLCGIDDEVDRAPVKRHIANLAQQLLAEDRPGDHNQAMMELGAVICTPRRPSCLTCPVRDHCVTLQRGSLPETRPVKRKATKPQKMTFDALLLIDQRQQFLLGKRHGDGLMGSMWELPAQVCDEASSWSALLNGSIQRITTLEPVKHQFTHIHATYHVTVYRTRTATWQQRPRAYDTFQWCTLTQTDDLPKTKVLRKLLPQIATLLQGDASCPNTQSSLPGMPTTN